MPAKSNVTALLHAEIAKSGLSIYRLAKDTGVAQPGLNRFANGERGLSLESAEAVWTYFGYELTKTTDTASTHVTKVAAPPKARRSKPATPVAAKRKKKPPRV